MGRHKKRHAFAGELEKQIHSSRRATGSMPAVGHRETERLALHERASHCQTLTPAPGELRGTPADVRLKMRCCDHFVTPLIQFATAQP